MLRGLFFFIIGLLIFEPAGLSFVIPLSLALAGIFLSIQRANQQLFVFIFASGMLMDIFTIVRWGTTGLLLFFIAAGLYIANRINEEIGYPVYLISLVATYFIRQRILNEPFFFIAMILGLVIGLIAYHLLKKVNDASTIQIRKDGFFT